MPLVIWGGIERPWREANGGSAGQLPPLAATPDDFRGGLHAGSGDRLLLRQRVPPDVPQLAADNFVAGGNSALHGQAVCGPTPYLRGDGGEESKWLRVGEVHADLRFAPPLFHPVAIPTSAHSLLA